MKRLLTLLLIAAIFELFSCHYYQIPVATGATGKRSESS
jgi:hypothetical protein